MNKVLNLPYRLLIFACAVCVSFSVMAAKPLTIAVSRSPLSLPLYVAEENGYFAEEGVQVRFNEVIGGHRAMQSMLAGKSDLATVSETVVMFNSFEHNDFALLASFVNSNDDIKLVTRSNSKITKISELAGKRIGTILTTASHYYLDTLLLFSGIDHDKVEIIDLQPESMSKSLQNGAVDAVAVWEPYPFQILANIKDARTVPTPRFYNLTFNLTASRKFIADDHGEKIVRLLHAINRAQQFIEAEPIKAQEIMKTRVGLEQAFVDWIWPHYNFRLSLDQSLLTTLESEARWARAHGHVKAAKSPNYIDFVNTGPLRIALPGAATITE